MKAYSVSICDYSEIMEWDVECIDRKRIRIEGVWIRKDSKDSPFYWFDTEEEARAFCEKHFDSEMRELLKEKRMIEARIAICENEKKAIHLYKKS